MNRLLAQMIMFLFIPTLCLGQQNNDRLISIGLQHNQQGKYQEAIHDFSTYLAQSNNPKPEVYRHRGFSYYYVKKYDLAIDDFKKAQEIAPGETDASFALGKIYYQYGNYKTSLDYFNQELSYHPANSKALNDRGMVKCSIRNYDGAIDDFIGAFQLDSTFAMAYNNAGAAQFYNQDIDNPIKKDIEKAKEYFNQAIVLDPTLSIAYRNRGAMNLFLDLYDEALADLKIAGKLQPDLAIIPFYEAIAMNKKGNAMAAVQQLKSAIKIDQTFIYAYEEIGDIFVEKEQYDKSIDYYKKALSYTPSKNEIYKGLIYYKIAQVHALYGEKSKMYAQLATAKRLGAFSDKKVYQRFLKAPAFKKYRREKKFRSFTKAVTKIKKEYKFLHSELRWYRMND
jgi:tetratricopeptide (TPR) repeat protein